MACWNPSTLYTNRGVEEWPVGIPLPQIPIEDSKNGVLESLYLISYIPIWGSLLVCKVEGFQQAILVILYWYVR
jgi:hypothetical protein